MTLKREKETFGEESLEEDLTSTNGTSVLIIKNHMVGKITSLSHCTIVLFLYAMQCFYTEIEVHVINFILNDF